MSMARCPPGASASACGAEHVAAQQGSTEGLKLLYELDPGLRTAGIVELS